MNCSSDKCIVLPHCYIWDRTIRVRESEKIIISSLAAFQLVMRDMLYKQDMKPRDAPCETSTGPLGDTFMDYHSIFMNLKTDTRFNSLSNAVLETITGVQKRDELTSQSIPMAMDELIKSMGPLENSSSISLYNGNQRR